ncbi:SDR family NAD(P)-dependent oxidoreductase [Parasulfitobacter algicola]|uniref:SDR family NAD(P)-dependent oxidoreductase n=1 Tax=Parasulfitobacter algicola TaxID=2614809 RepID=A0ABX2IQ89_9RHOB|nr:SDR family NAD(P)-dependent oxidoreductase [Sulfitobacter algicola]NSX54720.1 SDR family NAD(P)-dependent oxidoreductase [Sulfitobacter algicola]
MTVLITGANRGIGRALFDGYQARGENVHGTTRSEQPDPNWHYLDVTDPASHLKMCKALDSQTIDLLVCNAGIYPDKSQGLADGYPPEMWAEGFATNVTGVFLTVQNLLPNLQMSDAGKIAIISSQMASDTRAPGGSYIYRASKAAALNLGRNLAADLKDIGVAVGIYHPGWVQTDMGGSSAEITVDQAAKGLITRFDALDLDTTGVFETWDGHPHDF